MVNRNEKDHIAIAIAIGFILPTIITILSSILDPPDWSGNIPVYSTLSNLCFETAIALMIFGSTLMGIKLADEKKVMPAAGFTMFAIANGVVFVIFFEMMDAMSEESFVKTYNILTGYILLELPALILISFYTGFPKWINWIGILSMVPFAVSGGLFLNGYRNFVALDQISMLGFTLLNIAQVSWGILVLKNRRREQK